MEEERFVWSIWLKLHSGKYSQLDKAGKGGRNEAADKLENFQYAKTITQEKNSFLVRSIGMKGQWVWPAVLFAKGN